MFNYAPNLAPDRRRDPEPDLNEPEPEVEVHECGTCLAPLAEGDEFDVRGDVLCPACAFEWAIEILAVEAHSDWAPTRELTERIRALAIVRAILPRLQKRIEEAEAERVEKARRAYA